jgi:hypothetical protein
VYSCPPERAPATPVPNPQDHPGSQTKPAANPPNKSSHSLHSGKTPPKAFPAKHVTAPLAPKPLPIKQPKRPPATDPKPPDVVPPKTYAQAVTGDFWTGQARPLLTVTAGQIVPTLKQYLSQSTHPLAERGIARETRTEHRRILKLLSEMPENLYTWPIARAILETMELLRQRHRWTWATTFHKSGMIAAALKRLPQYTQHRLPQIRLIEDEEWRDATKNLTRLSHQNVPSALPAATQAEVSRAIEATQGAVQAFLIVTWLCAARSGDVSKVLTKDVTLSWSGNHWDLAVFFRKGKVITKTGPYTINTKAPKEWGETLQNFLNLNKTSHFLFCLPTLKEKTNFLKKAREAIRAQNTALDLRSLRRGAAQTMAAAGVPLTTILLFTKHADMAMLKRYLRFGMAPSEDARKAIEAASALMH